MFFDGTGVGIVFISPQRQILPYSFILSERCSNNVAEYQALIIGLQMTIEMKITSLEICGNSKLVINQLPGKRRHGPLKSLQLGTSGHGNSRE